MIEASLVEMQATIWFYRECQVRFPSAFRHDDYRAA